MLDTFTLDRLFMICAYGGTAFYVARLLIGFGGALDTDSMESFSDHFSDDAFHFLSMNTLVGFFMMFGWGGLAASRQYLLPDLTALIIGLICGTIFIILVRMIFKSAKKLVSHGTVLDIRKAVGKQGKVYQTISENKRGVIQVTLDDFKREFDAISIDNREIPSFQFVEILKVIDEKTVVVRRVK